MARFYIKAGDRYPAISATLRDANEAAVDLTGISGTHFHMASVPGRSPAKVDAAASIVGLPIAGVVRYDWAVGDTDTPGEYYAEWEVTFGDGKTESFPNWEHTMIIITEDVA